LIQAMSHERTLRPNRIRRAARLLAAAPIACMGLSATCAAQAVQPREALEDAKLYFTAPLHWDQRDWLEFGGTLVVLGIAHQYDDDVREHFVKNSSDALSGEVPITLEVKGPFSMCAAVLERLPGFGKARVTVSAAAEAGVQFRSSR